MSDAVNRGLLRALQAEVKSRLESDSYFADVTVLAEDVGVTVADIDNALKGIKSKGGKRGAAVVVNLPQIRNASENVPGPQGDVEVKIQCYHIPRFNDAAKGGTGKEADEIALTAINVLHHYLPDGIAGVRGNFLAKRNGGLEPIGGDEDVVGWICRVTIPATVGRSARVARPAVSVDAGLVTATCATTGAAIYWTADGSYPGSGNPDAASLYTAPIPEPASPYLLRFAAEVDDDSAMGSQTRAVEG